MSHPIPGHDYSEQAGDETHAEHRRRRQKARHAIERAHPTAKTLGQMMNQPASKHWFERFGMPKSKALKNKTK